jgi:hypothetical protein
MDGMKKERVAEFKLHSIKRKLLKTERYFLPITAFRKIISGRDSVLPETKE